MDIDDVRKEEVDHLRNQVKKYKLLLSYAVFEFGGSLVIDKKTFAEMREDRLKIVERDDESFVIMNQDCEE